MILQQALLVVLVPLCTGYLKPAQLGAWALLQVTVALLIQLVTAPVGAALTRFYYHPQYKDRSGQLAFTLLLIYGLQIFVIAGLYLDGGFDVAREFVLDNLRMKIDQILKDEHEKNYKSLLQDFAQRNLSSIPGYRVIKEEGPDHRKMFQVTAVRIQLSQRAIDSRSEHIDIHGLARLVLYFKTKEIFIRKLENAVFFQFF